MRINLQEIPIAMVYLLGKAADAFKIQHDYKCQSKVWSFLW